MADPIEAHYTPDGDDWTIAVKGRGRTLTGRAPGLIAARDRADQLVEQLTTDESGRKTVVHMLNGDAVEFTTAYLTARLARTDEPTPAADGQGPATAQPTVTGQPRRQAQPDGRAPTDGEVPTPAKSAESDQQPSAKPTPAPRTESQAAQPAAQPAPEEEPTPSGS